MSQLPHDVTSRLSRGTILWPLGDNQGQPIRHMRVPIYPIKTTGSWWYLTGSWRETTPYFMVILLNVRGYCCINANESIFHLLNLLGIRITVHNHDIMNQEAKPKIIMVESAQGVSLGTRLAHISIFFSIENFKIVPE